MTDDTPNQQHRIPGVRYRKVKVERPETTVIDGVASTRIAKHTSYEPMPPRDVDELVRRGVMGVTIGVTVLAVTGTTASVGGLLAAILPKWVAYSVGAVFTSAWMACLGVEWLERIDDRRARAATIGGWVALAISMGAVITYGHELNQLAAGVVGSCLDLLSKGLWVMVLGLYRTKLNPGVAHWVVDQEQRLAAGVLVGTRLRRLNRLADYMRTVGGREYQAAQAIITAAAQTPQGLPVSDTSGQAPAPAPGQVPGQAPAPVPGQPPAPCPAPGAVLRKAPAPPPAAQAAAPAPPAPSAAPAGRGASGEQQDNGPEEGASAPLRPVGPPSIAGIVRKVLAEDSRISDDDLIERVKQVHGDGGDPLKFAETVTRTRRRIENPTPRKKKRTAS